MAEVLFWLNQNQGAVIAVLTGLLCLFNSAVVWFAYLQIRATQRPDIIAFIEPDPIHAGVAQIVVANVGQAAAIDVMLTAKTGAEIIKPPPSKIPGHDGVTTIPAILPGAKQVFKVMPTHELVADPNWCSFGLVIEYKASGQRKPERKSFNISLEDWKGFVWGPTDPTIDLTKAVKSLDDRFRKSVFDRR